MKKYVFFLLALIFFVSLYGFAEAKIFTIKGNVKNSTTNKGIPGAIISGNDVPAGVITDAKGRFSFPLNSGTAATKKFTLTPPVPASFSTIYALSNNLSRFWETTYLDQVAGIFCASKKASCSADEVLRDRRSNSGYDFVVEQAVSCAVAATSTLKIIPDSQASAQPAVITDGSRVMIGVRGTDALGSLFVNASGNLSANKWGKWINIGGQVKAATPPALRALGKNRFGTFFTAPDDKKFGMLRSTTKSITPILELPTDFSFASSTSKDVVKFKNVIFKFSKTADNKIQYQQCL